MNSKVFRFKFKITKKETTLSQPFYYENFQTCQIKRILQ